MPSTTQVGYYLSRSGEICFDTLHLSFTICDAAWSEPMLWSSYTVLSRSNGPLTVLSHSYSMSSPVGELSVFRRGGERLVVGLSVPVTPLQFTALSPGKNIRVTATAVTCAFFLPRRTSPSFTQLESGANSRQFASNRLYAFAFGNQ